MFRETLRKLSHMQAQKIEELCKELSAQSAVSQGDIADEVVTAITYGATGLEKVKTADELERWAKSNNTYYARFWLR